ncbi:MAG: LptF/LptG family permease [Myxococcota bacterium]|nr:LptF/LptG family permease [Myxococcota bacterium]
MRTLSRYFVKRYLSFFVAILFFSSLAVAIIEMALGFESIHDPQQFIGWALTRVPSYYLSDLAPLSAYLATLFSLGLAARWLEWNAIQAAGIAPWRVLAPIMFSSLCLAVGTAALRESLVPLAFDHHQATRRPISEQLNPSGGRYQYGRTIFEVRSADSETGRLYNIRAFVRTPKGRLKTAYKAPIAELSPDGSWRLIDVTISEYFPNEEGRVPIIRKETEVSLALTNDPGLVFEKVDSESLPLPDLVMHIADHRQSEYSGTHARILRLEQVVHERLADPWLVIVMTVLAMPVALRVRAGRSLAPPAVASVALMGLFFFTQSFSDRLAASQILTPTQAVWTAPTLFIAGALISLWREQRSTIRSP